MPIGTITMILATVGSQVYNSWCNSRQNAELQQKREEYEFAARRRNTEQMWRLLREGQELTMQLEAEKHQQRLDEMKGELDNLLHKLTYEAAISNWPLKVLPIVMKNQAFGNLLANQEESVAMHIFFTRSNYEKFNRLVFPIVEKELEQYCNKYWSTVSDHPVLFYSGAWKTPNNPTSVQIDALRSELRNLPTLLIMPFFRPSDGKLVFQAHLWGVGALSSNQFEIPEIEPISDEFHFKYTYTDQQDYEKEGEVLDSIVKDLVPYLQCLIGYMADTYFWSSVGLAPHLPLLVTNGTINTDRMKYLISDSREYYEQLLLTSEEKAKENPFMQENLLNLYDGSAELWDEETRKEKITHAFLSDYKRITGVNFLSLDDALQHSISSQESLQSNSLIFSVLNRWYKKASFENIPKLQLIFGLLTSIKREEYEIIDVTDCNFEIVKQFADYRKNYALNASDFVFIIWNKHLLIGTFSTNNNSACIYLKSNTARFFIIRHLFVAQSTWYGNRKALNLPAYGKGGMECEWNGTIYKYTLQTKKLGKMKEKNFENQFEQSFARFGKGLGQMIDGLSPKKNVSTDPIWGDGAKNGMEDGIEQLLSYFIENAKRKTIPSIGVEDMSVRIVLDWVDNNVTPFADKVYIIKGQDKETKKFVFCSFFGSGDSVLLKSEHPCVCFVTSDYNEEMKQTFNDNNICVIPLK